MSKCAFFCKLGKWERRRVNKFAFIVRCKLVRSGFIPTASLLFSQNAGFSAFYGPSSVSGKPIIPAYLRERGNICNSCHRHTCIGDGVSWQPCFEKVLSHILSVTSSTSAAFRSLDVGSANGCPLWSKRPWGRCEWSGRVMRHGAARRGQRTPDKCQTSSVQVGKSKRLSRKVPAWWIK